MSAPSLRPRSAIALICQCAAVCGRQSHGESHSQFWCMADLNQAAIACQSQWQ